MAFINLPAHEQLHHITYRSSEELASRFGFTSVEYLAESIPSGEKVIDVGAGLSRLGHDVAGLRQDIEWVNFDVAYAQPDKDTKVRKRLGQLVVDAPDNLHYVAGSILNPPEELKPKSFARIFSYWMLPYLIENDPHQGAAAAWNMVRLGKTGGIIRVGPMRSYADKAQAFIIPESREDVIELAVNIVKPWLGRNKR